MLVRAPTEINRRYTRILLLIISEQDYVGKISKILGKKPQTITEQINQMIKEGFLIKDKNELKQYNIITYKIVISKLIDVFISALEQKIEQINQIHKKAIKYGKPSPLLDIISREYKTYTLFNLKVKDIAKANSLLKNKKFISNVKDNKNLQAIMINYLHHVSMSDSFNLLTLFFYFIKQSRNKIQTIGKKFKDKNLEEIGSIISLINEFNEESILQSSIEKSLKEKEILLYKKHKLKDLYPT